MKNQPNPVDLHVGNRIRLRRFAMGCSQEKLAEALGVSFQQVQKYENGRNRVSASRLWEIAKELECHTAFFFEGIDDPSEEAAYTPNQLTRADVRTVLAIRALPEAQQQAVRDFIVSLSK